ncbi:uncharacterized protein LOC123702762 isoform X1 [Colias croceus]|uniref:uncharacterized protein LOC123702762 isoform X1 n=1 Tax=Colias crocea TaxID=72248 RepID=UPI001E280551|nr:uncharacterized protein LOC123702762 isoform X1 [Colias croceus]
MTTSLSLCFLFTIALGIVLANPTTQKHTNNDGHNHTVTNSSNTEIEEIADDGWDYENTTIVDTRRILYSKRVGIGKRPYMVYLQLTKESAKAHKYRGWLCGGVIVHPSYVMTSAACVEDADHFYIVSGTTKFVDSFDYKNDECVCKHRRKVVWKCIPKNYKFDFHDSIKWSANDIAIVKVDKPFKLGVVENGCEFATDLVCYNNVSRELEKSGTKGFIAGWGSGNQFREGVYRRESVHIPENSKYLQEAKVCIMDNEQCAKKWAQRFRSIITQYMICTKDVMKRLSEICDKKYANCTDVESRRHLEPSEDLQSVHVDLGRHLRDPDDYTARRSNKQGGFCENDHGGPLLVRYQGKERVVGIISACKIDPKSHSCHGPFLYTSVFRNRQFISCSINKDVEESCRRVFRSGITHEEWDVNWDNVEEDDDTNKAAAGSSDNDKADEDSDGDRDVLREESPKKKPAKTKDSGEANDDDDENQTAKLKHSKKEKPKEKHTKQKSKSKTKKGKRRGKDKNSNSRSEVKAMSYESSRDDNVNEPDEE